MSNVIDFTRRKVIKNAESSLLDYKARIMGMDKLELLEEMVRFQEEKAKHVYMTYDMMLEGQFLFKCLEESAETDELRLLTRSYRRHLEHEIATYKEKENA